MPPTLSMGAFVVGAVLLLISVLSGGFKIFGAEVSGSAGRFGRVVAFAAGVVLIATGFLTDGPRKVTPSESDEPERRRDAPAVKTTPEVLAAESQATGTAVDNTEPSNADQNATLQTPVIRVTWRPGGNELQSVVASMPYEQRLMLGFGALLMGQDVYAIHVRIDNVGAAPVTVHPEHLALTLSGGRIPLSWIDDRRFLGRTHLRPNEYTDGILTFQVATLTSGAVFSQGRLAYLDSSIEVRY
jgi:hypothetical protein